MQTSVARRNSTRGMDKIHTHNNTEKGDLTLCKNYRTIALINHMGKVLMIILLNRLKVKTEEYMSDEQAGFRKDRSTV